MKHHEMLKLVEDEQIKPGRKVFHVGDTVAVHYKITEGDKQRIQIFTGTVIARGGSGMGEAFTVRRLVGSQGVERVFPLNSPHISKLEVTRRGRVRRAKLYYLRDRLGKATRVTEKRGMDLATSQEVEVQGEGGEQ